jgi:tetratricopeptide (TPR) repeat protein
MEGSKISFALDCVASTVPATPKAGDSALQRRILPHANRYLQLLAIDNQSRATPSFTGVSNNVNFNCLGILYSNQGKLAEAEAIYVRALKGKEKAWGPDHMSTLDTVNNLGALYSDQGKLAKAEAMYVRALKGYEKAWGPDHTSTLDTVNNLGLLYSKQGKLAEAEAMYVRALKGYEKARDPDHRSTSDTAYNLVEKQASRYWSRLEASADSRRD